jgi:hypothetical protein
MEIIKVLLMITLLFLSGCASFDIDGKYNNSRTLQAEERMLLVTDKANLKLNGNVTQGAGGRIVCAEPSPDAMSALAYSGTLKGGYGQASLEASAAMSQTLGELGERTPVIQMLRDSLYRACEALMNGQLSDREYKQIVKFFDVYSMTTLAIEDLTRTPHPPVIVGANGNAKVNADASLESNTQNQSTVTANTNASDDLANKEKVANAVKSILCNYYQIKLKMEMMELNPVELAQVQSRASSNPGELTCNDSPVNPSPSKGIHNH